METGKFEQPKLPNMVMCGDHPSFTKTELNAKDDKLEDKLKDKTSTSYARLSPKPSGTERVTVERTRPAVSEHALRLLEARRRVRSLEVVSRQDDNVTIGNKTLLQAALGSMRWPPYLVATWVVVLVLAHLLHCLVSMLERALPNLKKFCQYCRTWAEDSWQSDTVKNNLIPLSLACVTGLLYAVYYVLYAVYSAALWSIEPLCSDDDKRDEETKVTNYDEINKTALKE